MRSSDWSSGVCASDRPIHLVEHVLYRAADPDLVFERPKPVIGVGGSRSQSAANHRASPSKRRKDQSAPTSGDGGVSPSSRRRNGSGADESQRDQSRRKV